jgi:hypothetical protein
MAMRAHTKSAPAKAVLTATSYVTGRFGLSGISRVKSRRSHRKPDWVLVTGTYGRPGERKVWAAWVQFYDERWLVKYAGLDAEASRPPKGTGVPCDIRPAFGKPAC